jgi:hypothetical protein
LPTDIAEALLRQTFFPQSINRIRRPLPQPFQGLEQMPKASTSAQPKVWENFTQENLESAFEKIAKELRAFGLL